MISMHLGMPTVNGYSGFEPHPAFAMAPRGIEYQYNILDWLLKNGADSGVCELGLQTRAFRGVNVAAQYEEYEQLYRASILQNYTALFSAATRFLADGNDLSDLYPQYLEEHGYLEHSFGYQTGPAFRWMQDRYWIGERSCARLACFGIGVIGTEEDLRPIIQTYASQALRVLFPYPQVWTEDMRLPVGTKAELRLDFPAEQRLR
jgi:hypothetical protein